MPVARLSNADQWHALSDFLAGAINGAEQARRLQKAANQQLDLAQYGLSTLADELSPVLPAIKGRDRAAKLHVLGPATATLTQASNTSGSSRADIGSRAA